MIEGENDSNNVVEPQDPKEPLQEYNWEELEERFIGKMDERQAAETEIYKEFNTLLAVRYMGGLFEHFASADLLSGVCHLGTMLISPRR